MFFDRENEPDLGDSFGYGSEPYNPEEYQEPSFNTTQRRYTIPLWMFDAPAEILVSFFEKRAAEQKKKELAELRNHEISELEAKLAKLKEGI